MKHIHQNPAAENMQETSSLPLQPSSMPLSEFLEALFEGLDKEGVRFCVLRNYEGFPTNNIGSDVDFLIRRSELPRAVRVLCSIQGIRIVGFAERYYVAHLFVEGVSSAPGIRALGLDFIWSLQWKGLPHLPTDAVLEAATPRQAASVSFCVPSLVHEAIISLLSTLLINGSLKEKYFPKVQQTFTNYRSEAIAALSPKFGSKAATQLVDSVIDGSREKMVGCVKTLRISLVRRGLLHEPCRNTMAVARYYACEFAIRFSPGTLAAVCILSSNNGDTTTIIEGLLPILQSSAKLIETRPLMQQPPSGSQAKGMTAVADLRAKTTGSALALLANIARWLLAEWLSPFRDKKNVTLQISQSYYYDLLLGSRRHSYGTSSWLAQLAKMLLPPADLWILLGADGTGSQSGDPEVLSKETVRQLEAYRSFVKTKKRYVILDLRKPAADVVEEAYAAIIDILAQRADGKLRNRF